VDEKQGQPVIPFPSTQAWERWLAEHHATSAGVWVKMAKKASGIESVTHVEALDVALCYGWIDGQRASLDETWFLQRFTRRRPLSKWSKVNREKVAALIAANRMQPAGLAAVEAAQADGRWDQAYDPPSKVTVPDDLRAALDANPEAAAFFATLNSSNRYAILYRVHDAKRPETRARRIEQFVGMLADHQKPLP
jgi:uncharacterized protein YdeI (YjbR/CyaY-like superfamily)